MAIAGLGSSFLAAIQASLSVLLVIFYGALAARWGLLDSKNGRSISKICVKVFLPMLLLVKIGSELHPHSAHRYLIILLWAFLAHTVSFLIGVTAHLVLGLPDWITAAIMFNNTTSYPLLLIQSLEQTGVLSVLVVGDESTQEAIERAKSYFLIFATVSSCLTFAVGPRLIDTEMAPETEDAKSLESSLETDGETTLNNSLQTVTEGDEDLESGVRQSVRPRAADERTSLLQGSQFGVYGRRDEAVEHGRTRHHQRNKSVTSITFFPSKPKFTTVRRRPFYIPRPKWSDLSARVQWWLLFFYDFLNAPLLGAVLGAIIGLTPPLHKAFFHDTYKGGIFTAWLTESWKNVGGLFVPLPLIVAGISLYTSYKESKEAGQRSGPTVPWLTAAFILMIRFAVWPVLSIGTIYAIVRSEGRAGILGSDPMLWFTMMLMPTGPPAMKLITMVQVSDAGVEDERRIARILTISYIVSPVLAFTVVGALKASQSAAL